MQFFVARWILDFPDYLQICFPLPNELLCAASFAVVHSNFEKTLQANVESPDIFSNWP